MSVYSKPATLTLLNPCYNSTVNLDQSLKLSDLNVPMGLSVFELAYKGPTDSMSALYGNGYDKCGALIYEYLSPDGTPFNSPLFRA